MTHDPTDPNPAATSSHHVTGDPGGAAGMVEEQPPRPAAASNRLVPDAVARRFLQIDDRYFFPDRTLAFVDQGTRLKVRTHNLEVIHSVVAIMQARGWQVIQLKGTEAFRRAVWHEASLQGIEVRGYAPTDLETQQLQRARARRPPGTVGAERGAERVTERGPNATERSPSGLPAREIRSAPGGLRPPVTGELLAHAAAPYHFDPSERMSYYARVRTPAGERTFWGADLERALAESRSAAKVGDQVSLRQQGGRSVTIRVARRNDAGELVGETRKVAQRMGWTVEKTDYVRALGRKADVVRQGQMATSAVLAQYPDLAGAMLGLRLARQFAHRLTQRPDDQQRVVEAIRHSLADAVERGERIGMPPRRTQQAPVHARGRTLPRRDVPEPTRE